MYSQNQEEHYILNHFKDRKGSFLDAGAYDGIELSNTRALVERGWSGVCFEPNPNVFKRLVENQKAFKNVHCFQLALGNKTGTFQMQMNDTYYSTLIESEVERWKETNFKFAPVKVKVVTFKKFMLKSPIKEFQFLSIDCEGFDFDVLSQIDLDAVKCEMVCVETNGKETDKYIKYIAAFEGFKVVHINAENLIMAR